MYTFMTSLSMSESVVLLLEREWPERLVIPAVLGRESVTGGLTSLGCSSSYVGRDSAGKYDGIIADISGRSDGRHAIVIAPFVSSAINVAVGGLAKVGSFDVKRVIIACNRTILTMHTLQDGQQRIVTGTRIETRTYKPPSAKKPIKTLFCGVGRFNFQTTGIGRIRIAKFCTIFKAPFVKKTVLRSRQCPPTTLGSQNLSTGVHNRTLPRKVQMPYATLKPRMIQQAS